MTEDVVSTALKAIQATLALHTDALASHTDALAHIRAELAPVRAQLDGLPLLNRSLTVLHQELRGLKAAFNDFARTNVTTGEIEALHADVNRVLAENAELAAKVATLERLVKELQD